MAHGAKRADEAVSGSEKFFFYLHRFNAVALFLLILAVTVSWAWQAWEMQKYTGEWDSDETDFGSKFEPSNSIIGQAQQTRDGEIVAYYDSDDDNERKENAGLVIVNSKSGKTLKIVEAGKELLVDFEFLFDQSADGRPVIGYIAKIANEAQFKAGRADLIVGGLPALSKNVVARDVQYADMPQVRSDGSVGIIIWQTDREAEVVGFNINDGNVTDRAKIDLPIIKDDQVSQGPGRAQDPELLRDPHFGAPPINQFH